MESSLTLFITSLLTAPLVLYGILWLITENTGHKNSDQAIGTACLTALAGLAGATIWVVGLYRLGDNFFHPPYLPYIQIADGFLAIIWLIIGWRYLQKQPYKFAYTDAKPVLYIEVRAEEGLLQGNPIEDTIAVQFVGGEDFNLPHPEAVRKEGTQWIFPWETTLFSVAQWHVRVFINEEQVSFKLNLPKPPKESTSWSEWMQPAAYRDDAMPKGLMLRYCFRIVPYGSVS